MAERNHRLRCAREQTPSRRTPGACLGRQELAELVNEWIYTRRRQTACLDKNYIGKLERGLIHWPDEAYRMALRAILGAANDAQLGFYDTRRMPAHTTAADRDQFLESQAAPGRLPKIGSPCRGVSDIGDPCLPAWSTMTTKEIAAAQGEATNRRQALADTALGVLGMTSAGVVLGRAKPETPVPANPAIIDHLAELRAVLVDADNRLGAVLVLPTVQHQLALIARLRRLSRGRMHAGLLGAEARWAEFAGWLSDDLGDRSTGAWWLGQAMSMAQEADDIDLTAFLFARMAKRAALDGDEDRVLGLAEAAVSVDVGHSHIRAFGILQRALGHAFAGEVREFESAVDRARALVELRAGRPDDLGSFCTTPYVLAQEAEGWLRLDRPQAAAERLRDALAMWPASYQRDRGLYLSRAAAAHLANQEPDEAATTAMEALEVAEATRSSRVGHQVLVLSRQLLAGFGEQPTIAQLLAAIDESALVVS